MAVGITDELMDMSHIVRLMDQAEEARALQEKGSMTSGTRKLVGTVAFFAWCVLMASLITAGTIETRALSQPSAAIGEFSRPTNVKGAIRYLTVEQMRLDHLAHYGIVIGIAIFILAAYFLRKDRMDKNSN